MKLTLTLILGFVLTSTAFAQRCDLELDHDNSYCNVDLSELKEALREKGYNILPMRFEVGHNFELDLRTVHYMSVTSSNRRTMDPVDSCVNTFRFRGPGEKLQLLKVRGWGTKKSVSRRTIRRLMRKIPVCENSLSPHTEVSQIGSQCNSSPSILPTLPDLMPVVSRVEKL